MLRSAQRFGLSRMTFRLIEMVLITKGHLSSADVQIEKLPQGLPIPPAKFVVRVAGTPDRLWFLRSGKLAALSIVETLQRRQLDIEDFGAIMDFGSACGRVLRHWSPPQRTKMYGTDCEPELVEWCRRHLTDAQFETNSLAPPLRWANHSFDFIYAISVFSHLPKALQGAWIAELARVLKPGGHLLLTTHGEQYFEQLTPQEQDDFRAGQLVVRYPEGAGTNLCCAFHPAEFVRAGLARGFDLLEFIPGGAKGTPEQDCILLRKPEDIP